MYLLFANKFGMQYFIPCIISLTRYIPYENNLKVKIN